MGLDDDAGVDPNHEARLARWNEQALVAHTRQTGHQSWSTISEYGEGLIETDCNVCGWSHDYRSVVTLPGSDQTAESFDQECKIRSHLENADTVGAEAEAIASIKNAARALGGQAGGLVGKALPERAE